MKSKIKVGDVVDYHSIIGGPITSTGHTVKALYPKPNNFGGDCAKISGRSGVVAIAALTPSPAKNADHPAFVGQVLLILDEYASHYDESIFPKDGCSSAYDRARFARSLIRGIRHDVLELANKELSGAPAQTVG